MTKEEIEKVVGKSAAIFKLVCGVGNNAAWLVMMEGYDHARRCKAFRRSLKGGHSVGWYFKRAINDFNAYERNLLTTPVNRMFHVADMSDEVRRKYGDISDVDLDVWYADREAVPSWAAQAVGNMEALSVLSVGSFGSQTMEQTVTRADAAQMLSAAKTLLEGETSGGVLEFFR